MTDLERERDLNRDARAALRAIMAELPYASWTLGICQDATMNLVKRANQIDQELKEQVTG